MKKWVDDAKSCVEKSISAVDKGQIEVAIYYLLRFFHDEDRWHSYDMAMRVFKDFLQKMGEKYIENVEEDILSIFLSHMALFCPGTAIGPSLKVYPYPDDPKQLKNAPIKKNPLHPMSRIMHAMLSGYHFKSMDYRVWTILDTLFTIYINVVKTCEHVRMHPKQTL
ncbi:hypothetical protein J437_LFUL009074 [Ladona fulva]|uniref:Uncharacterized protein n=1 Tax=Ladona fulva TaxID=123851 RepID=A0A8K0K6L6_LADFU|nr:hypothetical protein J437_LFUL009074 [Ladona fulva]